MNITRHNYEEFFILYLDNELDAEGRREVEDFAAQHRDLQQELELLGQTRLVPDTAIVFSHKDQLLKTTDANAISLDNYEEWLLLYTDNELNAAQKQAVELFAAAHPAIQKDLDILQQTKLQPDTTVFFPDKETLYRKEEKVRVIPVYWKRIAAAAAILFAAGTIVFVALNKKEAADAVADGGKKEIKKTEAVPADNQTTLPDTGTDTQMADNTEKTPSVTEPLLPQQQVPDNANRKEGLYAAERKQTTVPSTDNKKDNGLPKPTYNPYVNAVQEENNPIAKLDAPSKEALTIQKEIKQLPFVTPDEADALDNVNTASLANTSVDPIDENEPGRKNKLRGFFRKLTRTFEKTTNIKATDDEDRLLIGGLAIRL